jgi:CDP-paratose 2-epimerase
MSPRLASRGYALVTGGAGFIGTNLVQRLLAEGHQVVVLDDFSRPGVEKNAEFCAGLGTGRLEYVRDDCRNAPLVEELVGGASQVFHFAAQVAVTTSLSDPLLDFDVNARGTLTVLEAIRKLERRPSLVFTSTNKVYGALPEVELSKLKTRYEPADRALAGRGISEQQPLDFHSPYGCSKGAADQYVIDYARTFELPAVVFRMSCIYGPHQCGNEDQGWVAHFVLRALERAPIVIYGDGLQVRDLLFVEDLVEALCLARDGAAKLRGNAYNIGGGPANTSSLVELLERLEGLLGHAPEVCFRAARQGDQRYYVSDVRKFWQATGWQPKVPVSVGVTRLHGWLSRAAGSEWPRPTEAERIAPALAAGAGGR